MTEPHPLSGKRVAIPCTDLNGKDGWMAAYHPEDVAAAVSLLMVDLTDLDKKLGKGIWNMDAEELCFAIEKYCQQRIREDFADVVEQKP